jgi:hypothetical protein
MRATTQAEQGASAPSLPLTLREARALAAAARLEVTVARVAGRVFVSLHEPRCTAAPAVCFEPGSDTVFAGRRTVTPASAGAWLAVYRKTADSFPGGLVPGPDDERDRRLAHLAPPPRPRPRPHPRGHRSSRGHDPPLRLQGDRGAAAQSLPAVPLVLAPAREAAIVAKIRADARRWHQLTGDPARYIAGCEAIHAPTSLRATWREEEGIRQWIGAHPEVLTAPAAESAVEDTVRLRETARRLQGQAKTAYDACDYARALALVDAAELADPSEGSRLVCIRAVITQEAARTAVTAGHPDGADHH